MMARMESTAPEGEYWDFSRQKHQTVLVHDDVVTIRPVSAKDLDFFINLRMEYSAICSTIINMNLHSRESVFLTDLCQPATFFCIIEDTRQVAIGYLGIKDTRKEIWELAIELDKQYTHQGYCSRSIKLYLNEICRITGKKVYRATVESDNIASQRCFESIGAELAGLCYSGILRTPKDRTRFEEENLNLIDNNMRSLADRLGVEPRKLLSHVLEYRMTCPL